MANTNKVNGFRPVRYKHGGPWTGKATAYVIPAADTVATFVGDLVKLGPALDESTGLAGVTQAVAADTTGVLGVVVAFEPSQGTSLGGDFMSTGSLALDAPLYRVASTRRVVYVADDPNLVFEAQEDGDTDPLEEEDVNMNVNFIVGSGSTTTGNSAMQLDSSTHATTNTLALKLVGFVRRPDNEWVTNGQSYSRWLVTINNHQLVSASGSEGV